MPVLEVFVRFKICSKCNLEKDLELFSFRTASKDGRHTICKECVSKYDKARYCSSKRMKKYYANHLSEKDKRILYYNNNKEKYFTYKINRRAAKLDAIPVWFDGFDYFAISEAKKLIKIRNKLTGVKWELDHIVPLQNEKVCGLHYHKNWQLLTQFENRSKGNKLV